MSIEFTGGYGCPHVGASASSLVLEKVLDALDESEKNLQETITARDEAIAAKDEAKQYVIIVDEIQPTSQPTNGIWYKVLS